MPSGARSLFSGASSDSTACAGVELGRLRGQHRGWLLQRSTSRVLRGWRRRFVVLADERLYVFRDDYRAGRPLSVVDLTAFRAVQQADAAGAGGGGSGDRRHGFVLRTARRPSVFDDQQEPPPPGELALFAESEPELHRWLGAVSKVFVAMDMRAMQSPLPSFDALVLRAGKLAAPGGSILGRLERQRAAAAAAAAAAADAAAGESAAAEAAPCVSRSPSESTLAQIEVAPARWP